MTFVPRVFSTPHCGRRMSQLSLSDLLRGRLGGILGRAFHVCVCVCVWRRGRSTGRAVGTGVWFLLTSHPRVNITTLWGLGLGALGGASLRLLSGSCSF